MNTVANKASVGQTLSTVLGSVNSVAISVASVFDSATTGVAMGHRAINLAAQKQELKHRGELELFQDELVAESTMRKLNIEDAVIEYVGNDQSKQQRYAQHQARMLELIRGTQAPA